MSRFWFRLLCFIPIPVIMLTINYWVDPGDLFGRNGQSRLIAQTLAEGKNVEGAFYCDNGIWRRMQIESLTKKDVLVLGSSRVASLHASAFPGHSFVNMSVLAAQLGDLLSLYRIFDRLDKEPFQVVLGADPLMIAQGPDYLRWKSLRPELIDMHLTLRLPLPLHLDEQPSFWLPLEYLELLSPSYFQQSVGRLSRPGSDHKCLPTDKEYDTNDITLPDGSLHWTFDNPRNEIDPSVLRRKAESDAAELTKPSNLPSNMVNQEKVRIFAAFVKYLQQRKIHVVLFLTPYHPLTFNELNRSGKYPLLQQAQSEYEAMADQYGMQIVGSYNPSDCSLSEEDFWDGLHLHEIALARLLLSGCRSGGRN